MSRFGWAYIGVGQIANTTARELVRSDNNEIAAMEIMDECRRQMGMRYPGETVTGLRTSERREASEKK